MDDGLLKGTGIQSEEIDLALPKISQERPWTYQYQLGRII